ncbi:hypothetical protein [Bacillus massiliigorillae]|uniref:hypothetical protein n=1 Tax=Bacillus massiliigorillae TaxID=1243664 RepID=UPI00039ED701|nr:hypothetical protein [Bacillus massiliigorillae]
MGNKKNAKYKVGDTVVITMYGTVGNITDVKFLEGCFVYEVNYSEGLYMEPLLVSIEEYDGHILQEKEQINIEYKFFFGDLVQVEGYEEEYFKVVGFRTEIWRYKENAWEDVVYELSRLSDGEWLEAQEDELVLIADAESADLYFQKLGLLFPIKKSPGTKEKVPQNVIRKQEWKTLQEYKERKQLIDNLLDLYNDYAELYKVFQDDEYKKVMLLTLLKLKGVSSEVSKKSRKNSSQTQ